MSPPEVMLWQALRQRPGGFKFRRQCPQAGYSLDFACLEARLAIEVDGDVHDFEEQAARDEQRDRILAEAGFATLRIAAAEVFRNMDGVIMGIIEACRARGPLHQPAAPVGPPPRSGEDGK
jgi:very-short-patch-repair endonuclease